MKVVLALILVAASMVTCEDAPSKDEGKDKFATKKEVEEQKADLEEQKADLAKLREELKEEIAKVKVGNSNLRRADSDVLKAEVELRRAEKEEEAENAELRKQITQERNSNRQADVLIETKKLIRAEIETYLNTHSVCQMGRWNYDATNTAKASKTITFPQKFSKKPQGQVALSSVQWNSIKADVGASASAEVEEVTTTSMKITVGAYSRGIPNNKYVYATWIACM